MNTTILRMNYMLILVTALNIETGAFGQGVVIIFLFTMFKIIVSFIWKWGKNYNNVPGKMLVGHTSLISREMFKLTSTADVPLHIIL